MQHRLEDSAMGALGLVLRHRQRNCVAKGGIQLAARLSVAARVPSIVRLRAQLCCLAAGGAVKAGTTIGYPVKSAFGVATPLLIRDADIDHRADGCRHLHSTSFGVLGTSALPEPLMRMSRPANHGDEQRVSASSVPPGRVPTIKDSVWWRNRLRPMMTRTPFDGINPLLGLLSRTSLTSFQLWGYAPHR